MAKFEPVTEKNVVKVLKEIICQIEEDKENENQFATVYAEEVDMMLEHLFNQDFFGTEGQLDPRGDHRD